MGRKQRAKSDLGEEAIGPRLLAGWQRALLWAVWFGFIVVVWRNSRYGVLGWTEAGVLAAAVAVTVWCHWHRYGKPKVVIREPAQMVGEFASRPSWPWLLVSAFVTLGGIAISIKLTRDLHYRFTTISGVFVDVIDFSYESWLELASRGRHGDITHTHLYVLVVLLPVGLGMLWYNLLPVIYRGRAFRVGDAGSLQVNRGGKWMQLDLRDYVNVVADGSTITFEDARVRELTRAIAKGFTVTFENSLDNAVLILPQWRVFSREHDTPVAQNVIAGFFRRLLESHGFRVETREPGRKLETAWIATRTS